MSDHILTKKNAETVEMTEKCEIYSVSKKMSNTICCVGDDAMLLCYLVGVGIEKPSDVGKA